MRHITLNIETSETKVSTSLITSRVVIHFFEIIFRFTSLMSFQQPMTFKAAEHTGQAISCLIKLLLVLKQHSHRKIRLIFMIDKSKLCEYVYSEHLAKGEMLFRFVSISENKTAPSAYGCGSAGR